MNVASLSIGLVLATALLPLALQCRKAWPKMAVISFALWAALPVGAAYLAHEWDRSRVPAREEDVRQRPREIADNGYVQSKTCRACHPGQYASWHDSFHRTMTQRASPEAVLGDFDDVRLDILDRRYHLFQNDGKFFVDIAKRNSGNVTPAGTEDQVWTHRHRGEIVMTTGSHHMQAYWYTSGRGRLTVQLPFVWLRHEQAWIPEHHSFLKPDQPPRDDKMTNWNTTCINCHTTNGCQGGLELDPSIDTRAAEFGIACEACHGPAEEHLSANRNPLRRYNNHFAEESDPTIENPAKMTHQRSSEVCGSCHAGARLFCSAEAARRAKTQGPAYRPGGKLSEERLVLQPSDGTTMQNPLVRSVLRREPLLLSGRFWSDGMARVSGTEYNAMIDSPCYVAGEMSCMSCHLMHQSDGDPRPTSEWTDDQLKVDMRGNEACLQCHDELRGSLTDHTHHDAASTGSSCYNCHMPHTTFGLLKAIRSHTVSSPSVQESLRAGRPNACNQCHLDKTLAWSAKHLDDWFGIKPPALDEEETEVAASVLWTLTGDAGQRALMAWSLGWNAAREVSGSDWQAPYLAQLLVDPYPAVRIVANRSLIQFPEFAPFDYDLMGSAVDREAARQSVLLRWNTSRQSTRSTGVAALLVDQDGQLQQTRFDELAARRDDRFVSLEE